MQQSDREAAMDLVPIATREALLKYFDFMALTELGGKTFGKTGSPC